MTVCAAWLHIGSEVHYDGLATGVTSEDALHITGDPEQLCSSRTCARSNTLEQQTPAEFGLLGGIQGDSILLYFL